MCRSLVRYVTLSLWSTQTDSEVQDPPNLQDNGPAPDLPARPTTAVPEAAPPPAATPGVDIAEQARMLKEYED